VASRADHSCSTFGEIAGIGRVAGVRATKQNMKNTLRITMATLIASLTTLAVFAAENPMVGGAPMSSKMNIVENASKSKDHTTLVAAVKAAGLVETLQGKGPFTVFAPTNEAFGKLPAGTVETLVKPESKQQLTSILTYHVVAGDYTAAKLITAIKNGGGSAELTTVNGEKLTATTSGDSIKLTDAKGGTAMVTIADVMQSNGVIHVVDSVLMP
jgi:uncharacterized surface protein with fasciclin (FAS1) repeats